MTIIDSLQNVLQPIITDLLLFLILGAIGWLMRRLPEKWRMDIEAKHRDALHQALDTGVGLLIDTLQKHPGVMVPDMAAGQIVDYVRRSVPGAIRKLNWSAGSTACVRSIWAWAVASTN